MKKIISILIALLLFVGANSQSIETKAAYDKLAYTVKDYKITPYNIIDSDCFEIQGLDISYSKYNLTVVFNIKTRSECLVNERNDKSGIYRITCPINSITFNTKEHWDKKRAYLDIRSTTGLELTYRGKKELIEDYYFVATKMTTQKLHDELVVLQRLIIKENFTGDLSHTNIKTKTNSSSTIEHKKTISNKYIQ